MREGTVENQQPVPAVAEPQADRDGAGGDTTAGPRGLSERSGEKKPPVHRRSLQARGTGKGEHAKRRGGKLRRRDNGAAEAPGRPEKGRRRRGTGCRGRTREVESKR